MKRTRNFADVIRRRLVSDARLRKAVEREKVHADLAMELFEARSQSGLTQQDLARLCNTQQSVIARMEDAEYQGHSISKLIEIASVMDYEVKIDLCRTPQYRFPVDWPETIEDQQAEVEVNIDQFFGKPLERE